MSRQSFLQKPLLIGQDGSINNNELQDFSDQTLGFDYVQSPLKFKASQYTQDQIQQLKSYYDNSEKVQGVRQTNQKQSNTNMQFIQKLPVFLPNTAPMLLWKFIVGAMIVLIFFEIPAYVSFGQDLWDFLPLSEFLPIVITVDIILFLDILVEFCTAYYMHGNLVTDNELIIQSYLRNYFLYDLIGFLVFVVRSSLVIDNIRVLYLIFFIKYPPLMKIDLMFEEATLLHRTVRTIYNFAKILMVLQFCFLLFACGFYLIGTASVNNGINSWLLNDGNFGVILQKNQQEKFFFSYYFSLGTMTTTMGYGDITPLNMFECTYCLGGIMFAVFIFQVNVNSLFKIMEEFNILSLKLYRYRVAINRFMKAMQVPQPIQERIRQYLNEHWYEEGSRDITQEQAILLELAPELREELMFNSYGQFLQKVPLFNGTFSRQFLRSVSLKITEIRTSQGEKIFNEQDDQSIFYIKQGRILISANNCYQLKELSDGDIFGEYSFYTGLDRQAAAVSVTYCTIFKIARKDFIDVLSNFNEDFEIFWMQKDEIIYNNNLSVIYQKCWSCGSSNHYASGCDVTHYKPNLYQLLLDDASTPQVRQKKLRNIKKWRTLSSNLKLTQRIEEVVKGAPIKNMSQSASKQAKQFYVRNTINNFDRPYQFKNYYPKFNFDKIMTFKSVEDTQKLYGRNGRTESVFNRKSLFYQYQ